MQIDFPYPGYERIAPVEVPDRNLMGVYGPRTFEVDEAEILRRGFASPIGAARLREAGLRRASELGGAMAAGYLPDQFGHAAQLPQLLRRAGIGQAVLWRGVPSAVDRHAFAWSAPDGSTVRTEYLVGGYGNAADLLEPQAADYRDPFGQVGVGRRHGRRFPNRPGGFH